MLAHSLRQTALLGTDHIGTDHIGTDHPLLALLGEDDCTGTRLLHTPAPLDIDRLREHLRHHTPEHRHTPTTPDHRVSLDPTDTEHAQCTAAAPIPTDNAPGDGLPQETDSCAGVPHDLPPHLVRGPTGM
ncbi:Clp protease N-terminal domain-containing protein [Rhodococcus ruber]|uniref:Clp protease N-terminal domain-containing protein n=1 Tax=Rhodococcus ruber TaxID=1830 RepID=UPI000C7C95ED|nr:Clp protease N-terminal domain-containing protein [Rhodococcus ruber]AUM20081.1 hypothetical protein CSW53_26155 [Rhodococcus ruber]